MLNVCCPSVGPEAHKCIQEESKPAKTLTFPLVFYKPCLRRERYMERRVVITGLGIISPLGTGKEPFWQSLVEGRSGIRRLTRFDPTGYDCQIAGEIPDASYKDLIEPKRLRRMTNAAQLAVSGAQMALADAGLSSAWPNPHNAGVIVGTSVGNLKDGLEQQSLLLERG